MVLSKLLGERFELVSMGQQVRVLCSLTVLVAAALALLRLSYERLGDQKHFPLHVP